jgi:hypothetical protein
MSDHNHEEIEDFEVTDWKPAPIAWAGAITAFFLAIALMGAALTIKMVTDHRGRVDEPTIFETHALPPTPRLQTDEAGDLAKFQKSEREIQTTYGWIDPLQGTVRLPIDRAMELTARELGGASR